MCEVINVWVYVCKSVIVSVLETGSVYVYADMRVCVCVLWFCWDGVPITPHAPPGKLWPHRSLCARDRAGPGTMCLVCGLLFLSMTRAGIFQLQGTQAQSTASRDRGWARGMGLLGPWGSPGVGVGWSEASGPSALTRSPCCLASGCHRGLARNTTGHVSMSLVARKGLCLRILPLKLRAVLCGLG